MCNIYSTLAFNSSHYETMTHLFHLARDVRENYWKVKYTENSYALCHKLNFSLSPAGELEPIIPPPKYIYIRNTYILSGAASGVAATSS